MRRTLKLALIAAAIGAPVLAGGAMIGHGIAQQIGQPDPNGNFAGPQDGGQPGWFGHRHGFGGGEGRGEYGPPGGPGHPGMPPPPFGPRHLAEDLAALETELGIRANQLDAWRDFTDNLQAAVKPPRPPEPGNEASPGAKPAPFALASLIAQDIIAKGHKAEALTKAIETLKTVLTPEQLDKVAAFEQHMRRPPPPGDRGAPPPPPPGQ